MRERDMLVRKEGLIGYLDGGAWALTGQQVAGEWSWMKGVAYAAAGAIPGALVLYLLGMVESAVGLSIAYLVALVRAHRLQADYLERERERELSEPSRA